MNYSIKNIVLFKDIVFIYLFFTFLITFNTQAHPTPDSDSSVESSSKEKNKKPSLILNSYTGFPIFHPIFDKKNYDDSLLFIDASYAFAKMSSETKEKNLKELNFRTQSFVDYLQAEGWSNIYLPFGATGPFNDEPDASFIAAYHEKKKLIIFSFHGSRNGSIIASTGDWGFNADFLPVSAQSLGITGAPSYVSVHSGFGKNFQSVQKIINDYLFKVLGGVTQEELEKTWIFFVGHSRGGAEAVSSAAFIKNDLNMSYDFQKVNVGALLLSSPRVFSNKESKKWVHEVVGENNIIQIYIKGDPTHYILPSFYLNYSTLGILIADPIENVLGRINLLNPSNKKFSIWNYCTMSLMYMLNKDWIPYYFHYAWNSRNLGAEFDPRIVIPYEALATEGLLRGRLERLNQLSFKN